nr:hypothetical protein [Spirochaetota bacterium]
LSEKNACQPFFPRTVNLRYSTSNNTVQRKAIVLIITGVVSRSLENINRATQGIASTAVELNRSSEQISDATRELVNLLDRSGMDE